MARIGEKYREAALALVAKAYSTIRIADLAVYLGQVIARTKAYSRLKIMAFSHLSQYLRLKLRRERKWQPWAGLKNQEWSVFVCLFSSVSLH